MSVCVQSQSAILNALPAAFANVSVAFLESSLPVIPGEWESGGIRKSISSCSAKKTSPDFSVASGSSFYDIVPEEPCVVSLLGELKTAQFIAFDSSFFNVIGPAAKLDIIESFSQGQDHVHEAPVWLAETNELLYSDTTFTNGTLFAIDIDTYAVRQVNFAPALSNINGGTLASDGLVYLATNGGPVRGIYALNLTTNSVEPIVNNFRGRHFNSPNDLILDAAGNLYFTDPTYGIENGWKDVQPQELPRAIYRMNAKTKAVVALSVGIVGRPNGLALSPDERKLYVADSNASMNALSSERGVWAFDVPRRGGPLENPRLLYLRESGTPDGVRTTKTGLVVIAGYGGVEFVDPVTGFVLGRINAPDDVIYNVQAAKGKGAWLLTGRDHIYKASIVEDGA